MISLEKLQIQTPLQKLPKTVGDLSKIIVAKGFKNPPKVQKIVKSCHSACNTGPTYFIPFTCNDVNVKESGNFSCEETALLANQWPDSSGSQSIQNELHQDCDCHDDHGQPPSVQSIVLVPFVKTAIGIVSDFMILQIEHGTWWYLNAGGQVSYTVLSRNKKVKFSTIG